jgi:hypothetical protein
VIAAYFPILFKYLNPNLDYATQVYPELHLFNHDRGQMIFIENNIHTYAFMIVFGTTLLHVVVPTMMTSEFFITKGLSTKENDGKIKDRISLALIIPGMYFTYVLFLTSAIGVRAPYPVFNFNPFAFETTQPPAYFQ